MAALTATPKMRRTIPTMISVITIPMSRWYPNSTQIVVVPVGFLAGKYAGNKTVLVVAAYGAGLAPTESRETRRALAGQV